MGEQGQEIEARSGRKAWSRYDHVVLGFVLLVAAVSRLIFLADPPELVFDEVYYAKDACWYVTHDASVCGIADESTTVHPPLGKWLIAIGVGTSEYRCVEGPVDSCTRFSDASSFGWRIVPSLAGIATVALLYLLARRIFGSTLGAGLSAGLLALDPLHLVQSRVAMLDIFLPLFGVAAVLSVTIDRDRRLLSERASEPSGWWARHRAWRWAAGAAAGAAIATKWSGALILLLVITLSLAWESGRITDRSRVRALGTAVWRQGPSLLLSFVLIPLVVYLLTYIGRIDGSLLALPWSEGSVWRNLAERHHYMYFFHKNLDATHSYQSPAEAWLLIKRPVSYYFCAGSSCKPAAADGIYREIFATGNPFVWWASIPALIAATITWARRLDMRGPEGVIVGGFLLTYVPWLLLPSGRSATFIFYLLPTVPFMCLALGWAATRLGRSWEARTAVALFAAGAVATFAFLFPLLTKRSLPEPEWRDRLFVFDNCDKPPGQLSTQTVTVTENGEIKESVSVSDSSSGEPPPGWCWI